MPLPSVPQTFALEDCRDLLRKLEWEIEGLKATPQHAADELVWRAFNAAVTAWQISDWVWEELTPAQMAALNVVSKTGLQNKARDECRAIHLCRQIATASKHREVGLFPDPKVETIVSAAPTLPGLRVSSTAEIFTTTATAWKIKIRDDGVEKDAVAVFEQAADYWCQLIYGHGVAA